MLTTTRAFCLGDSDGDDAGLLKKVTGFDGTKVEYDYNERRIEKVHVTSSDATKKQVLEYTYNDGANGDIPYDVITTITDVNGKETTFEYDVLGRVTSVTIPADGQGGSAQTWQYAYAANGDHYNALEVTVTRPDSEEVVYQYNPAGTLAWVDAPDVGGDMKTEFGYDNQGRLLQLTDPEDNVTLWSYDAAGRVIEEKIAQTPQGPYNTTLYGYNPDGQIAFIGDPLDQTFEYAYDDNNWLSSITMTDTEETETVKSILYSWNTDAKTMLWTVSVGSDSVKIKYNEYGLLDYVDGVLDGDDANADLVRYGYDADYRLTELGYYIYDDGDYVLWTTSYDYDTFGRLETIEDRLGLTSTYAYNDDHTLESLTLPNGTVTDYTYDDLRRLVSIATTGLSASDVIVKFTYHYNDLGLRDKVTAGHGPGADGRTTEWSYDDVGRLVQEHFKSGGPSPETLLRYVYTYDAAGNRTSKKTDYDDDPVAFAATATYTNNGYNQVTAVTGSPGRGTKVNVTGTIPTAWTLTDADVAVSPNEGDPVPAEVRGRFFVARNVPLQDGDNTLVASTTATTLAGNEPSSDTVQDVALDTSLDEEYTYNANGDLIQKTEDVNGTTVQWDYTYDVQGWLIEVEKKVGGQTVLTEEYSYDPLGRKYKTAVTENQTTTTRYFVYDGASIVLELEEDSGDYLVQKEHVRGASLGGGIGGLLYTRDSSGTVGYFHYDGQGNVVSVTNDAREEIAYYEYDAWGNILTACGSLANEFAFSTKQASTSTGLIDFGFRDYDPQTGRWTRRDPAGAGTAGSLYAFVRSNPIAMFDRWGADPVQYDTTKWDEAPPGSYVGFRPGSDLGAAIAFFGGGSSHCGIKIDKNHIFEATGEGVDVFEIEEWRKALAYDYFAGTQEQRNYTLKKIKFTDWTRYKYDRAQLGLAAFGAGGLLRWLIEDVLGRRYMFLTCTTASNMVMHPDLQWHGFGMPTVSDLLQRYSRRGVSYRIRILTFQPTCEPDEETPSEYIFYVVHFSLSFY